MKRQFRISQSLHDATSSAQSSSTSLPKSRPSRRGDHLDAIISNAQGLLEASDGLLSAASVQGLSQALTVAKVLLDRIAETRANSQDKEDVIESISALVEMLGTNIKDTSSSWTALGSDERRKTPNNSPEAAMLESRILELVGVLELLLDLTGTLKHSNVLSAFWHAKVGADNIKRIRQKLNEATERFKIQGGITIQQLLLKNLEQARDTTVILERLEAEQRNYHERTEQDRRRQEQDRKRLEGERKEREQHERFERENLQRNAQNESAFTALEQLRPVNASYKSYLTEEKANLQPGTRKQILRDLVEWAENGSVRQRVYVLYGTAGMGKSSVAHALCRHLAYTILGASFFFVRGSKECSDAYTVFPTLAYQIACARDEPFLLIAEAAKSHLRSGLAQTMDHQVEELVTGPLARLSSLQTPMLLVVDGVDECLHSPKHAVQSMLRFLCQVARKIPYLRILISTRPETYIMDALHSFEHQDAIKYRDLQKEPEIDSDIRLFIDAQFRKCAALGRFPLLELRPDAVDGLMRLADGLFIYASTVVRFLIHDRHYAVAVYDKLLSSQGSMGSAQLYQKLDLLYIAIMDNAFGEFREDPERMNQVHRVLVWLVLDNYSSRWWSAEDLQYVGIPTHVTMDFIERLRSVLVVHEQIEPSTKMKPYHASFPQFLTDKTRTRDQIFLVEAPEGHALVASSLMNFLARGYSNTALTTVGEDQSLQWMWEYANKHWTSRLHQACYTEELGDSLRAFTESHLNDWLADKSPYMRDPFGPVLALEEITRVRDWCQTNGTKELAMLLLTTINRRRRELAVIVTTSPESLPAWDKKQIQSWITTTKERRPIR
ncbi:hypothetical protein CERSUDRAFT_114814 [Gelatoporia subvermispora B]|uniref:Nephrocystin 3-like N-terminal domain-containing protein n=1 Tax=Ceriporiopsis subvermispora (strain B) TaxID=914234 RepID=M2REM9_CERS8|nr:hypothetical protein CERSUDRAFT_114814 [Gelatoporia subvermispora B]